MAHALETAQRNYRNVLRVVESLKADASKQSIIESKLKAEMELKSVKELSSRQGIELQETRSKYEKLLNKKTASSSICSIS